MKCLYVVTKENFEQTGGGGTATRALKICFDNVLGAENVELCCFDQWGRRLPRKVKQLLSIARSLLSKEPSRSIFALPGNASRQLLAHIARFKPDLVVIPGGDIWSVVKVIPEGLPIVLIAHNIEHRLMQGQVDGLTGSEALLRNILQRDVVKLNRVEDIAAKKAKNILSISAEDAVYFDDLDHNMNVATFTPTFDYSPFQRNVSSPGRPLKIGFLAQMSWWPNQEAADWFVENILAHIDQNVVEAHFFGKGSELWEGRLPNLIVHGFVDALEDVWQACDLMICPMQSGSGVNIKFVEALYNRMPVLATPLAGRGITPVVDDHVIYLEHPDEWIEFLSSSKAEDLAAGSVSLETSNIFKPDNQRQHILDFLNTVVAQKTG